MVVIKLATTTAIKNNNICQIILTPFYHPFLSGDEGQLKIPFFPR
ncbi:hypothetical protein ACFL24_02350 [Patescibacteria group bacterium]